MKKIKNYDGILFFIGIIIMLVAVRIYEIGGIGEVTKYFSREKEQNPTLKADIDKYSKPKEKTNETKTICIFGEYKDQLVVISGQTEDIDYIKNNLKSLVFNNKRLTLEKSIDEFDEINNVEINNVEILIFDNDNNGKKLATGYKDNIVNPDEYWTIKLE